MLVKKSLLLALVLVLGVGMYFTPNVLSATKTLTVWLQADAVRLPGYELVIKRFEEAHPDIKIELTNVPGGWSDLYRKLLAAFAAGTAPDVLYGKGYWITEFADKGLILDLHKYFIRDQKELNASSFFFNHLMIGSSYKGHIYGLPRGEYWYTPGYNVDLFKQAGIVRPPNTWEEFRTVANKLSNPDKKQWGFALSTYSRVDPVCVEAVLDTWTRQAGGQIMSIDKKTGKPTYNLLSKEAKEAFKFVVDNIYVYKNTMPPELEGSWETLIYNGQIAMWWLHGGHISRFRKGAPNLNFSSFIMPKKVNRATYIADNKFMINAKTKYPEEAWSLIKWFTSKDMEALVAPYEGHLSVWKENWKLPVFQHPAYQGMIRQFSLPETIPFQTHPGWESVRGAIARELQKAIFGKATVEEALQSAQKVAEEELQKIYGK